MESWGLVGLCDGPRGDVLRKEPEGEGLTRLGRTRNLVVREAAVGQLDVGVPAAAVRVPVPFVAGVLCEVLGLLGGRLLSAALFLGLGAGPRGLGGFFLGFRFGGSIFLMMSGFF